MNISEIRQKYSAISDEDFAVMTKTEKQIDVPTLLSMAADGSIATVSAAKTMVMKAMEENGKDFELTYPETGYSLPAIHAWKGLDSITLEKALDLLNSLPTPGRSELGDGFTAGENAMFACEIIEAVTYIGDGMELSAELIGPMTFVLKDDGTALSIEGEEEPYELRWYSDYAVAYIGETPTELAEISFDGNGNISVKMDAETTVIMAPFVETGPILGTWETSDRTVEITEDGKLKLIYKEDGYTNHMEWEILDGIPTVTLGTWKDSTIEFVDGYLIINYSVEQKLTRVGAVPEIYVGPGGFAVPAGDSSAAFLGDWVEESGRGVLTFNEDFTAVMNFTDGRVYDMNWKTTEDGAMFTSGNWFDTAMVIEDENTLNIGDGWMILYREGTQDSGDEIPVAQPIGAEGEAYFGTWPMDLGGMAMNLILNVMGLIVVVATNKFVEKLDVQGIF